MTERVYEEHVMLFLMANWGKLERIAKDAGRILQISKAQTLILNTLTNFKFI